MENLLILTIGFAVVCGVAAVAVFIAEVAVPWLISLKYRKQHTLVRSAFF